MWSGIRSPDRNGWAHHFDIDARVPPGATKQDLRLMLQKMLAERFGLKLHHEKKEVLGYNLEVAKNGPRLTPSPPAAAPADTDHTLPDAFRGPPTLDKDGFPVIPPGSGVTARGALGGRRTQRFTRKSMPQLAEMLAGNLGRPVHDATGLAGEYDFLLRWVADSGASHSDDAPGPNLFVAIQQQLGLKLAAAKTPIDVLVIDHVEKTPTEN